MARHTSEHDPWSWSGQRPDNVDDVPRWLVLGGLACGLVLTLLLLRYAIDLLGLVFIIVLVGFSIRTFTDWLSDSERVSAGSIAWVFVGLFGTALVALWLFGSPARAGRLEQQMPRFVRDGIDWAEDRGWGQRVLLPEPAAEQPRRDSARTAAAAGGIFPSSPGQHAVAGAPTRTIERRAGGQPEAPADSGHLRAGSPPVPTAGGSHATRTTLTVSPARVKAGSPLRLQAVVRCDDADEPPEGTVIFWSGAMVLGSEVLRPEGSGAVAQLKTSDLTPGTHQLSAEYAGTTRCRTSRSPALDHVVQP